MLSQHIFNILGRNLCNLKSYYRYNLQKTYLHRCAIRRKKRKREESFPDLPATDFGYCSWKTKMRIDGKIAMVVGGTGCMGSLTACQLLKNGCKHVVITGPNYYKCCETAQSLNNRYGKGKASFINFDVTDNRRFQDAFDCVMEKHCALDIFVYSAGMFDGQNWEKEFAANVVGVVRGTLLAQEVMGKDAGGYGGIIINVASVRGLEPLHGGPTYCASKHAVVGFTRSCGTSHIEKHKGIRIVTLCPGLTYTQLHNVKDKAMAGLEYTLEDEINKAKKQRPECCAQAILFLIKYADNGSVWAVEGSQLFEVNIPHRKNYSNLVATFM